MKLPKIQIPKLLHNPQSLKVLSFLVGFGLIILCFHKPILTQLTLSLPLKDIEGKIVKQGDKCYKYRAEDAPCENSAPK